MPRGKKASNGFIFAAQKQMAIVKHKKVTAEAKEPRGSWWVGTDPVTFYGKVHEFFDDIAKSREGQKRPLKTGGIQ